MRVTKKGTQAEKVEEQRLMSYFQFAEKLSK